MKVSTKGSSAHKTIGTSTTDKKTSFFVSPVTTSTATKYAPTIITKTPAGTLSVSGVTKTASVAGGSALAATVVSAPSTIPTVLPPPTTTSTVTKVATGASTSGATSAIASAAGPTTMESKFPGTATKTATGAVSPIDATKPSGGAGAGGSFGSATKPSASAASSLISTIDSSLTKSGPYGGGKLPVITMPPGGTKATSPDEFDGVASKYSTIENLTGITNKTPDIIMLTRFKPLYEDDFKQELLTKDDATGVIKGLSAVGEFADIQIQLRTLVLINLIYFIRASHKDPAMKARFTSQTTSLINHLSRARTDINFLFSMTILTENIKKSLSLTSDQIFNYSSLTNIFSGLPKQILDKINLIFGKDSKFASPLIDLGFDSKNVTKFSSTKLYCQQLYELKQILDSYSYKLSDASSDGRATNSDPIDIKKTLFVGDDNFQLASFLALISTVKLDPAKLATDNVKIISAWRNASKYAVAGTDDIRTSIFANALSKEYKFSIGLAKPEIQFNLNNIFSYKVSNTLSNPDFWDSVFGKIGNKITDIQDNNKKSLFGLSQFVQDTVGILPFEPKYLDYLTTIYTPGGAYFVDSIFESDTLNFSRLKDYTTNLKSSLDNFVNLADNMNLLSIAQSAEDGPSDIFDLDKQFGDLISDTPRLMTYLFSRIDSLSYTNKNSAIVMKAASVSDDVYSSLFAYTFFRSTITSTSSDFSAFITIAIDAAKKVGTDPTSPAKVGISPDYSFVSEDDARTSLTSDIATLMGELIAFVKATLTFFDKKNAYNTSGTTFYSGATKEIIALLAFDIFITALSVYVPHTITAAVDISLGSGFIVQTSSTLRGAFSNSIIAKLKTETDITFKIVSNICAFLGNILSVSSKSLSSLKSAQDRINDISALLEDKKTLQFAISEAQIILMKSYLDSIDDNIVQNFDPDLNEDLAGGGNSLITDDTIISASLRKAFYSFFADKQFIADNGYNQKVITVGLPWGFSKAIKEKVKAKSLDVTKLFPKQTDVININVYKTDFEYQDIVFKPQQFLFELSRFVPRSGIVPNITLGTSIEDLLTVITTKDYSLNNNGDKDTDSFSSLANAQYDFLTNQQKHDLIKNHITSYFLELYIKILTGMSTSEYKFRIDESNISSVTPDFVSDVASSALPFVAGAASTKAGGAIFSAISADADGTVSDKGFVSAAYLAKMSEVLSSVDSVYSDGISIAQKLVTPKLFDRIFNIGFNSNNFDIDLAKTFKTTLGTNMFNSLLASGRIVDSTTEKVVTTFPGVTTSTRYKIKSKNSSQNHVAFEKFFVNIETILDTDI